MGTLKQSNVAAVSGGPGVTSPVSLLTSWVVAHDNVASTAETTTVLVTPLSYSNSNVHPIKISQGTRAALRARYPVGTATVTTSPVVRLYAVSELPDPATGAFASTAQVWRLDNDSPAGAGLTLTLDNTNDLRDATYKYSINGPSLLTYDMLGASCLLLLHETAANIGGGTVQVEISILN